MIYLRIPPSLITPQVDPLNFNLIFKNKNDGRKFLACSKGDILNEERVQDILQRDAKGQELVLRVDDLQTLDPSRGIIELMISPDYLEDTRQLIKALAKEIPFRPLTGEEMSNKAAP